jgi:CBS domain-containing protein
VQNHIDVLKIEIDGVRAMLRFPAVVNKVNDPELELATVESTFLVKGKSLVTNVGKEASSPLITASAGASVHRASVILVLKKIRRLPIATKELVGIITARDLGEVYAK